MVVVDDMQRRTTAQEQGVYRHQSPSQARASSGPSYSDLPSRAVCWNQFKRSNADSSSAHISLLLSIPTHLSFLSQTDFPLISIVHPR